MQASSPNTSRTIQATGAFGVLVLILLLSWAGHPYIHNGTRLFSVDTLVGYLVIAIPLAVIIAYMHRQGRRWRDYGLKADMAAWKVLVLAVAGAAAIMAILMFLLIPVIRHIAPAPPNVSHLMDVRGNTAGYITVMVTVWLTAAFGEEMIFRGFVMNEMAGAFGGTRLGWWASAILVAVFFGAGHAYQGLSGMLITAGIGFMTNVLYLLVRRNLWVLILAHGFIDTYSITRLYLS